MTDQFMKDVEAAIDLPLVVPKEARVVFMRERLMTGGADTSIYCDGCSSFKAAERIAWSKNLEIAE